MTLDSVIAVPPLARKADLTLDLDENRKIVRYLEAGGISVLLYGGNANLYHIRLDEYEALLRFLDETIASGTVVIPSVGTSFGMMMAQAEILRRFEFPTAMVLPGRDATTSAGTAAGIRAFVAAFGLPIVLYIKHEEVLAVRDAVKLVHDGLVATIKYAIVRDDPADDPYLDLLLQEVDPGMVVSGMGEQPAIHHMRDCGLASFTSGCVCVAPKLSRGMLAAMREGDLERAEVIRRLFAPLEMLRNDISPVRVLHEAVRLAGIAETGPLLPMQSNLEPRHHGVVQEAVDALMEAEAGAP